MSIKLFSLAKELNVGVGSLAGFLRKKGFDVEDNNPNVRIENEEFDLLLTEFGKSLLHLLRPPKRELREWQRKKLR